MNAERFFKQVILMTLTPVIGLPFSHETKEHVRQSQDNMCAETGIKSRCLEVHHKLPQCMGGSDRIENAVGLLGEKDCYDVHKKYDRLALEKGIMFNGLPISKAEPQQIKDERKWKKACKRFNLI